jgi:hypothetical protein
MMNDKKILSLLKKFEGGTIDVDGMILTPVKVSEKNEYVYFRAQNPNDVPYFRPILFYKLEGVLDEFGDYINQKLKPMIHNEDIDNGLYLSEEVTEKIQNVLNNISVITFHYPDKYSEVKIYGVSEGFNTDWEFDNYSIKNIFKPLRASVNGKEENVGEAVEKYYDFLEEKETYWESERLYSNIDDVINEYPLLQDYYSDTATYYATRFNLKS